MHAGEQAAVDDVVRVAIDDGLLVGLAGTGFGGGNEGRTNVGKVGAHGQRCQHRIARGNGAAERNRAVKPLADFLHQRKRAFHTGVATGAGSHCHQPVGALFNRLVGKLVVDDVVQHHTAPAVHRLVQVFACAQAGDDQRHLVFGTDLHVVLQPVVGLVHDLVDGKRGRRCLGMRLVVRGQRLGDFGQPVVQLRGRAGIERGHRADDAGLALGNHQLRVADDEQRRSDDRQREILQNGRQMGHGSTQG